MGAAIQNTVLWNEAGTEYVEVVYDAVDDIWRLAVDSKAKVEQTPEGIFGDEFQLHAARSYGQGETFDVISYTVPVDKKVFLRVISGSAEKAGQVLSPFLLLRDVATVETPLAGWYGNNNVGSTFQRGLEFNEGEKIIVRINNTAGANVVYTAWLNGSVVDV